MTNIQRYRSLASQTLSQIVPNIQGEESDQDLAVDDLIRKIKGLPPRPPDRKAYEGIFPEVSTTPTPGPGNGKLAISQAGIDLIKEFEGCELQAYPDPGTGGDPWTIGYGHTGNDVYSGLTITQEQAEHLLREDLKNFEQGVRDSIFAPLSQGQFDALVSFAYNNGTGALADSTLARLLNEGDYQGAADQFERWVNAGGAPMPGLVRRRQAERSLFLS